jgi:cytidyltransferase-like protein
MLHSGHVTFLKRAAEYGDLYVGMGSDYSIEKYKGKAPVCKEAERLFMVKKEIFNALMATKEFKGGVASFGLLGTAVAVGSLSAALISPRLEKYRSTRFVLIGSVVFCLSLLLISVMPSYLTYAISLPLLGATALTTVIAANSITQLNTDHEIRGRVMGIYQFVFLGGAPFSSPLIGWLSEVIGFRQTIALCSLATLVPIIAIWFFYRSKLTVPADISVSAILKRNNQYEIVPISY